MKQFSTVRHMQRNSKSHIEKKLGRMGIEVTRRKKKESQKGGSNLASNQIPKCSSKSRIPREIHRVI